MLCTAAATAQAVSYRLLATTKTSTMQKEMNEAATRGPLRRGDGGRHRIRRQ